MRLGVRLPNSLIRFGLRPQPPFAQFWTDGAAAYGVLDGVMRIAGAVEDPEEARSFLGAVGAAQVVCSAENGARLGLRAAARGAVLEKDLAGAPAPRGACPVRAVYRSARRKRHGRRFRAVLSRSFAPAAPRRGAGLGAVCGRRGGGGCGGSLGRQSALVTAVAVLPAEQGKGYGGAVLQAVEAQLGGCRAYLLRAEHETNGFTPSAAICRAVRGARAFWNK